LLLIIDADSEEKPTHQKRYQAFAGRQVKQKMIVRIGQQVLDPPAQPNTPPGKEPIV
jgi:predicted GTPase